MHEELNRKIAEFAGFEHQEYLPSFFHRDRQEGWFYPDGTFRFDLPDFTDPDLGIAYLFKWVVPEVNKRRYAIALYIDEYGCYSCEFDGEVYAGSIEEGCGEYESDGDSASMALCYAVEKLIDAKVPSEVK